MGRSQAPQPGGGTSAFQDAERFFADLVGASPRESAEAMSLGEHEDLPLAQAEQTRGTPQLPLLLAGPIVRRATPDGVWFWFASSEEVTACTPRLTVYDERGKTVERLATDGGFYPLAPAKPRVVRLGQRLWVVMVMARPKTGAFPLARIYGYDLDIETRQGARRVTSRMSSLPLQITYPPFALPTFLLPKKVRRIAHGSCRRPGGQGDDAFPKFDEWLASQAANTNKRPSALILTGDQIYADDVARPLFKAVQALARDISGYVELLPRGGGALPVSVDVYLPYMPPPAPSRKSLTSLGQSPIGFTTDDGEAHLLSFPEYAAMYLLVWNEKLCKDYRVDDGTDSRLKHFCDAAARSRRVLANTVTYMLFDDHDVTDDWNLNAEWETKTQNPMAQRIICNALAAYWAFQGLGNDPDAMAILERAIVTHLEAMRTSRGIPGSAAGAFDHQLLNRHWSFIAPTNPPALCVDTRTRRETPNPDGAAVLSGRRVWRELEPLIVRHKLPASVPLLIVLPTPLLPHPSLMVAQNAKRLKRGKYETDFEFYGNHPEQRADLINFLHTRLKPPALIVFSGDVHHGSVIDGLYVHGSTRKAIEQGHGDWAMRIAQVTSSPIKNIKGDAFVDPIEVPNPLLGGRAIPLIDKGTAGEAVVPMTGNTYHRMADGTYIGTRAATLHLAGPLTRGRRTYIYENHLCVVDVPDTTEGGVFVTFVGVANGKLATAETKMRVRNEPTAFKPPPELRTLPLPLPWPLSRDLSRMVQQWAGFTAFQE